MEKLFANNLKGLEKFIIIINLFIFSNYRVRYYFNQFYIPVLLAFLVFIHNHLNCITVLYLKELS